MAGYFIDKKLLKGLTEKVVVKAFEYIGRDLRTGIKKYLRKGTQKQPHSLPGEVPKISDVNSPLKILIEYSVNAKKKTVVAGPMIFHDSKAKSKSPVPGILEKGGDTRTEISEYYNVVSRRYRLDRDRWFKNRRRAIRALKSPGFQGWRKEWSKSHVRRVEKIIHIAPRPFVAPRFKDYLDGDGVKKAIMRARGMMKSKGYDSAWAWKKIQ